MPEKRDFPILFLEQSECCGCSACAMVCPTQSIKMRLDSKGFEYPQIEASTCIRCEKCIKVCAFKRDQASRFCELRN